MTSSQVTWYEQIIATMYQARVVAQSKKMEQKSKATEHNPVGKKMAAGMKELWEFAKKDLTGNTQELKQDFMDIIEFAKSKNAKRKMEKKGVGSVDLAVNQDAGAELLTHYKDLWADIHCDTEQSSKMATKVALVMQKIDHSVTQSNLILSRCSDEFEQLPEVMSGLEDIQKKVDNICEHIRSVEESLVEYSRVRAQLECERKKHSLKIQHERHCKEQEAKVEHLKELLVEETRLSEITKVEVANQELAERQQTFQDIFNQQMAEYRQHGMVERPITEQLDERKGRSGSQLEDVVIEDEDGNASLSEFLSDVPVDAETSDTTEPANTTEVSDTTEPVDTTEISDTTKVAETAEKTESVDPADISESDTKTE